MGNTKKAVFVSGASSGIGKQCALRLDKAGFKVFAGLRSKKAAKELTQIASDQLKPLMLDITESQSIDSAAHIVSSENLYGLVNNAGIAVLGPLEFLPLEKIRNQFEVNLFGHIAVTQAFLPFLRRSGGRIINMSSVSGLIAFPFSGPYASSKFAIEAFSDSLRRELRPWNIPVSLIEPGNIKSPIWEKSFHAARSAEESFPPEAEKYYGKRFMDTKRIVEKAGEPSAVAEAVLQALTAKRPKTRYVVGLDARKYAILKRLLPDWILDKFI
jgi:NAD(P)-dependent dehydrogenase (short-subunit alcohol dehydrogenase family)